MSGGRRDRAPRLLLICGVGTGNVGNDASLETVRGLFTQLRPDLEMVVATPFVDGAQSVTDLPVVPVRQDLTVHRRLGSRTAIARAVVRAEGRRLVDVVRLLRSCDGVVVTGTGIFDDFGERPWNMPYALVTWTMLARLLRRPFVFMAVGAGPIHDRLSRALMVVAARLATAVSYRDAGSLRFMESVGAGRRDAVVCPDVVFAGPVPPRNRVAPVVEHARVGLGVMSYGGWSRIGEGPVYEAYVDRLVETVDRLARAGHEIRFLVGQPCDEPVVRDVISQSAPEVAEQLHEPAIGDFQDLLSEVVDTDVVVATRYHNVVAALMAARPVVSLGYAPKNADLLSELGLWDADRPVEEATVDWVVSRTERAAIDGLPRRTQARVAESAALVRAEARRVVALLGLAPSVDGVRDGSHPTVTIPSG